MSPKSKRLTVAVIFCATALVALASLLRNRDEILVGGSGGSEPSDASSTSTTIERRPSKLADGCYHVFLDVGSNIGIHARFLLEPHLYPKAQLARGFFRGQFGEEIMRDNRDFCVFSFEPNPAHWPRHQRMKEAYGAMGWRYHPIHGGVGDEDGNLTFYHIGDEYGFTMLKSSCRKRCDPEYVPVHRLSSWIDREVNGRVIPDETHAILYKRGPRVVMKMDIEMMEWLVFPDLLDTGVFCRDIDGVMGEFHLMDAWFYYPIRFEHSRQGDGYTVDSWQNATKLSHGYIERIRGDPNCTVDMLMKDDESYRTDGMPWPKPSNSTGALSLALGNSSS